MAGSRRSRKFQLCWVDFAQRFRYQYGSIYICYRILDLFYHEFAELGFRIMQSWCINKDKLGIFLCQHAGDPCTGRLRFRRYNCNLLSYKLDFPTFGRPTIARKAEAVFPIISSYFPVTASKSSVSLVRPNRARIISSFSRIFAASNPPAS